MKTRITELLGTRYPVIQGGRQLQRTAERAAALSNAGGLGVLTAWAQPDPQALGSEIARCRGMTDQPFAIHIPLMSSASLAPYAACLEAAIDNDVRVLETAGNSPVAFVEQARRRGVRIIHQCTSLRHALSAERRGVDAIAIGGSCGVAPTGEPDASGLLLVALAARALRIPVIASGGIADGRGMAAALALGAEGVKLGGDAPQCEEMVQRLVNECRAALAQAFRLAAVPGEEFCVEA